MKLVDIDINLIDEDSGQPRREFDKTAIEELAESIREVGLLNPIKVYKAKYGRYRIVFGNRRYKALKLLGFRKIPCILSDNTDELDIYFEQLTENIQRRDFTPIEEAEGFQKLLNGERWQVSRKYLASRLGKTEKYIANKLALLVFGPEVRKLIRAGAEIVAGQLSEEQALAMKDVPLGYRDSLALKVARDGRGVRDAKRIAALFADGEFDAATKEKFLKMPCHELVALSVTPTAAGSLPRRPRRSRRPRRRRRRLRRRRRRSPPIKWRRRRRRPRRRRRGTGWLLCCRGSPRSRRCRRRCRRCSPPWTGRSGRGCWPRSGPL